MSSWISMFLLIIVTCLLLLFLYGLYKQDANHFHFCKFNMTKKCSGGRISVDKRFEYKYLPNIKQSTSTICVSLSFNYGGSLLNIAFITVRVIWCKTSDRQTFLNYTGILKTMKKICKNEIKACLMVGFWKQVGCFVRLLKL